MRPLDTALLLLLALIWGTAFMLVAVVVKEADPLTIVAGRMLIAAVLMTALAIVMGHGLPPRSTWPALLVISVTNNLLPFTLITWAQEHITSSLAATLNATMPLFTYVIAVAASSEVWSRERAAGVGIGFVGAAVLIGPDITEITSANTLAQLAVIVAAVGYGGSTVLAREKLSGEPVSLASGQMLFGAALMIPFALLVDGTPDLDVSAKAGLSWLALGVFSSGLAYLIYFRLIQRVSATNVAVVGYLIPVVATVLGWAVLDERIGVNLFVGLALIVVGMMAVNGTLVGLFARRRPPDPSPAR